MKKHENLKLRGRVWHYNFMRGGQLYRGSCGTAFVADAKVVLRKKIEEAEAGLEPVTEVRRDTRALSIEAMAAWDVDRTKNEASHRRKEATIKSIWARISTFFEAITDVSNDSVALYVRAMSDRGYTTSTIKRDLWAIRRAYAWAAPAAKLPILGPMPKLKASPKGNRKGRLLSHKEVKAFLGQLKGRALAHAVIALSTGIRREELARVQPGWVSVEAGVARITLPEEATKGKNERWVPLTQEIRALCRWYLPLTADSTKAWLTACRRADVDAIAMRDLRHTFASRLSRFDADAMRVICGWRTGDKNSSMFYQHLDEERAQGILDAIPKAFPYLAAQAKRAYIV